jgi:hypothetical protein
MGQSRRFDRRSITSGLLPLADIVRLLENQKTANQGGLSDDGLL